MAGKVSGVDEMTLPAITVFDNPDDLLAQLAGNAMLNNPKVGYEIGRYLQARRGGPPPGEFINHLNAALDRINWYDMREDGWFSRTGGTITMTEERRLDLDAMDKREEEMKREEKIRLGLDPDAPRKDLVKVEEQPTDEVAKLREENDKMRALISRVLDARDAAREFMTIWSDPRKLPELIQEVYNSHPDVAKLRSDDQIPAEQAQRAARLIAHMALTYELHPLMSGMIYAWVDGAKLIVEIGYRGYNEMLKRDGLDWSTRPMTDDERHQHGLKDDDFGYLCFVEDWARTDRFRAHGKPDPEPYRGVGVWRAENPLKYNKPDPVPSTKSGNWVSEKNAIKDAARKSLSFAVTKTADPNVLDFAYRADEGVWSMPIQTAAWVNHPAAAARFQKLLADSGITDEEFNAFLGHNWRYTTLEPNDIKAKVDELIQSRQVATPAAVVEKPAEKSGDEVLDVPALVAQANEARAERAAEAERARIGEVPTAVETVPEEKPAEVKPEPAAEIQPDAVPAAAEKPAEPPATPKKKGEKAVKHDDSAVRRCESCEIEPGSETPEGWLCPTCARNLADAKAAREEKKAA